MLSSSATNKGYFLSQPHQPFFLAGILWAIVMMLVFLLSYQGGIFLYLPNSLFHVYSMIFMIFTPFLTGFIFTTFPRFCQSNIIQKKVYTQIFYLSQIGSITFIIGSLSNQIVVLLGMSLLLGANILIVRELQKIYSIGKMSHNTSDPFWILIGFYFGVFTHLFFLIEMGLNILDIQISLFYVITSLAFWNYLIFVAFAVAQRMVPFFSHVIAEKRHGFLAVIFSALIVRTLFSILMLQWMQIVIDIIIAIYLIVEYRRWQLPTFNSPAILWVLHVALYWIPVALLVGALSTVLVKYEIISTNLLEVHLMAIGFLTTLLIGFGTRVTLGHSGQAPHADKYTTALFLLIQVVVILRGVYAFNASEFWLFDLSAISWILLYILWASRFGSVLMFGKKL